MVTPLAHVGYAGKSAITAMTVAGGASTTIDDVVWSAIVIPWAVDVIADVPESSEPIGYRGTPAGGNLRRDSPSRGGTRA